MCGRVWLRHWRHWRRSRRVFGRRRELASAGPVERSETEPGARYAEQLEVNRMSSTKIRKMTSYVVRTFALDADLK